jgi:uncharacterized protein DUF6916
MSVSRRRFLKSGAVMSAVLLLKPDTFIFGQKSLSNTSPKPVQSYSREMFEPYIGDNFRVRVGKQIVNLKLVALEDMQRVSHKITTGRIARTDSFSLRFHATRRLPATAKIRQLNHSKLGTFDLFMTQSKKGAKFRHTAIVNHLV